MTTNDVSDTRISTELLQQIIDGCEGVTPGPWRPSTWGFQIVSDYPEPAWQSVVELRVKPQKYPTHSSAEEAASQEAIAYHLARLDPATVKAMAELALSALASRHPQPVNEPAEWQVEALKCLDGEPEYHSQGMGCGLEDRGITDRYEAMEYGWERAMERVYSEHINPAIEALRAASRTQSPAEWERAARTFLSADDFEALQSLAVAFAEDRIAGVNTSLEPASLHKGEAMTVVDPDQWEPCSPSYLERGGKCDAPRVWNAAEQNHWHPRLPAAPVPVTITPDHCYDPNDWEYTMPWGDRNQLVEEWEPNKPHRVATLIDGPDKWVVILWDEENGEEIRWFDTEEEAAALSVKPGEQG